MTQPSSVRLGPIDLADGIRRRHAVVFLIGAFLSVGLMTFIAVGQTYVLNVNLGIPDAEQGGITGDLIALTEIVAILIFVPAGMLVDRFSRRAVYAGGFALLALTYLLYPFASSLTELFIYRSTVYALGFIAVTAALSTVLVDYPRESSRGKLVAIIGFLCGLGVAVIQGFGALPTAFAQLGLDDVAAGRATHFVIAAICILAALLVGFGLKPGIPVQHRQRPSVRDLLVSGFAEARNPRVLLAYSAGFIARGDQAVNAFFLILWGTLAGKAAGLTQPEAIKAGTWMFVSAQIAALIWAPLLGPLLDRLDRATALAICMVLAAIGNLSLLLLDDPLASYGIIFYILLGIGQISVFLAGQSLIGQEAPAATRGSVLGAFNISGAVGILLITLVGGRLFDAIDPRAPFAVVGCINVLLFLASLYVRLRKPRPPASPRPEAAPNSRPA
ncbi:MFS transporter [Halochromatium glycolicum]|uniref:MFS transporter n=1 Tax=Halochromatium glycolicum TaxID=85075 RepID=A0AAJ0XBK3_9GAMM|nr:MFS transporter [Halochromatium glycolicum]MBK1706503.1 MFS transporter [Halochromatium glycolicum]